MIIKIFSYNRVVLHITLSIHSRQIVNTTYTSKQCKLNIFKTLCIQCSPINFQKDIRYSLQGITCRRSLNKFTNFDKKYRKLHFSNQFVIFKNTLFIIFSWHNTFVCFYARTILCVTFFCIPPHIEQKLFDKESFLLCHITCRVTCCSSYESWHIVLRHLTLWYNIHFSSPVTLPFKRRFPLLQKRRS